MLALIMFAFGVNIVAFFWALIEENSGVGYLSFANFVFLGSLASFVGF